MGGTVLGGRQVGNGRMKVMARGKENLLLSRHDA